MEPIVFSSGAALTDPLALISFRLTNILIQSHDFREQLLLTGKYPLWEGRETTAQLQIWYRVNAAQVWESAGPSYRF